MFGSGMSARIRRAIGLIIDAGMTLPANGCRPVPFAAPVNGLYTTVDARLKSPFLNSIGGMIERCTRPALSMAR